MSLWLVSTQAAASSAEAFFSSFQASKLLKTSFGKDILPIKAATSGSRLARSAVIAFNTGADGNPEAPSLDGSASYF